VRFPWQLQWTLTKYIVGNALRGKKRYPFVLMLEPTHLCNLACEGCGEDPGVREHHPGHAVGRDVPQGRGGLRGPDRLHLRGEPTIYPHLGELVDELLKRKEVYLPLHQRHQAGEVSPPVEAQPPISPSTSPWTGWSPPTT